MSKKIFISILLAVLLASCAAMYYSPVKNLSSLELGMTKDEVISMVGKNNTPLSFEKGDDGTIYETIRCFLANSEYYYFDFENNGLVRWYKASDEPYAYPVPVPAPAPAVNTNNNN